MTKPNYQKTEFLLSAAEIKQLPKDAHIEIALVGRSNSGKSSVLNRLTENSHLARTSKTPGRTQLINVFKIDDKRRLIDLPGYGFAKVPYKIKEQWAHLLDDYFSMRKSLSGLILVMDIRHPLKDTDYDILHWAEEAHIPVHILLNKADKLSRQELHKTLKKVQEALAKVGSNITLQIFSALRAQGVKEFRDKLNQWFTL